MTEQAASCNGEKWNEVAALLKDLPQIVRQIRRQHNLPLRYVAEATNLAPSTICRFERHNDAPLSTVVPILEWLDSDDSLDFGMMRLILWLEEPCNTTRAPG
jgi:transcriptional regulator with XRE-family HTH domain